VREAYVGTSAVGNTINPVIYTNGMLFVFFDNVEAEIQEYTVAGFNRKIHPANHGSQKTASFEYGEIDAEMALR